MERVRLLVLLGNGLVPCEDRGCRENVAFGCNPDCGLASSRRPVELTCELSQVPCKSPRFRGVVPYHRCHDGFGEGVRPRGCTRVDEDYHGELFLGEVEGLREEAGNPAPVVDGRVSCDGAQGQAQGGSATSSRR